MAKLDIKKYPDKALKKKALSIDKITEDLKELAKDMLETMHLANGVGLAAPQVGVNKRMIVIDRVENMSNHLVLVNPRILRKKGRSSFCEGCLSIPEVTSDVVRPREVTVETLDIDGKELRIEAGGLLARVLQHEIDHLDGVLFIDRIGFLKRKKISKLISSKKVCIEL
ncbi:MAG: peptide deformylase [Candidatus Omnitrophota bacterium]